MPVFRVEYSHAWTEVRDDSRSNNTELRKKGLLFKETIFPHWESGRSHNLESTIANSHPDRNDGWRVDRIALYDFLDISNSNQDTYRHEQHHRMWHHTLGHRVQRYEVQYEKAHSKQDLSRSWNLESQNCSRVVKSSMTETEQNSDNGSRQCLGISDDRYFTHAWHWTYPQRETQWKQIQYERAVPKLNQHSILSENQKSKLEK